MNIISRMIEINEGLAKEDLQAIMDRIHAATREFPLQEICSRPGDAWGSSNVFPLDDGRETFRAPQARAIAGLVVAIAEVVRRHADRTITIKYIRADREFSASGAYLWRVEWTGRPVENGGWVYPPEKFDNDDTEGEEWKKG